MADDDELPSDENEIFDVDSVNSDDPPPQKEVGPAYRVYPGSKIAVGKGVGAYWQKHRDAAVKAHQAISDSYTEILKYYNFHHLTELITNNQGRYMRGDGSENIILSNVNTLLPAVYSQNPTFTCSTIDGEDKPLCKTQEALLNVHFRRRDKLDAKPRLRKQAGMALLTNFGITKLDWTDKIDSREIAQQEMVAISEELAKAKTSDEVDCAYGKLAALEQTIVTRDPAGPKLTNIHPHRLIVDPNAENPDACDGMYMMERVYMLTSELIEKYTMPAPDDGDDSEYSKKQRMLVYQPTHKAVFATGAANGNRDDGIGMVMEAIDSSDAEAMDESDAERLAYQALYHTECFLVWDKATRRVLLFHRDDWKWPIWVWDDPLQLQRFFPYFIMSFLMSTGGTMMVGEPAYYLDQQDEINAINKQVNKIRRTIYNVFLVNTDKVDSTEISKFENALSMNTAVDRDKIHMVGIKAGEDTNDMSKLVQAMVPPSVQFKELFAKEPIMGAIDRLTRVNDALRGQQFKTNTTEDAVQTYQESMRISIGAKVDVIEDVTSDIGGALGELFIRKYDYEDVVAFVGEALAEGYQEKPTPEAYLAQYDINTVAGSTEKPNSVFKKKEAIQIVQAVGQFAQGAPGAAMTISLKVLENAFSDVNVTDAEWGMLREEMQAVMNKGNNAPPEGGAPAPPAPGGGGQADQIIAALPPEDKAQVAQMAQQGASEEQIAQFLMPKIQQLNGGGQPPPAGAPQ